MAITQIKSTGIANGAVTSENLGTLSNISVSGTSNLGNVANVTITGGNVGQVLTTDGTGNLSWATPAATGPTITQIQITDSSYNVLDDTAVSTSGGYIKITGTGFSAGAIVVVGNINAASTTFVSNTVLNVQVPSAVAGTYTVYVVNTNGSTAIGVNGLTYSGTPNWVTASTLPNGTSNAPINIQLNATGDAPLTYALAAGNTLPSGLTLTSGGLLSGTVVVGSETVYAFTVIATDAEAQDSPRAFTITITVGDPYFYLTALLLPGNGTNNGTNNTFLDSSTNNFTITKNGNTAQGTFTPFSLTGWSNYFDGTGDSLSIADNAAFNLSSGDFTFECWIMRTGDSGQYLEWICGKRVTTPNYDWSWVTGIDSNNKFAFGNGSSSIVSTTSIALNTWYHTAVVRNGSTITVYVNGIAEGTGTLTVNNYSSNLTIGNYSVDNPTFTGYISNLRLVKGTAVYTTNFTPPTTPLTAIANTSLLTCQSNRFIDNSTNNFAITRNGDTKVQSFSPFAPNSSYSAGTVGGSAYFDGSGDWLSFGAQSAFDCGTSTQFCMEAWVYPPTSYPNGIHFWTAHQAAVSDGFYFTSNGLYVYSGGGGGGGVTTNKTPIIGAWNHCVLTRDAGGRLRYFLNGELTGTSTTTVQVNTDGKAVGINGGVNFTGDAGYQSQSRYIKGSIPTAYQTSSTTLNTQIFTPPTAPLTTTSQGAVAANVIALVNYTNGQIIDSTSKSDLETVGDAKISTAQSKWGGSSMYFDGTGDYLKVLPNNYWIFNGDYTIEVWVYPTVSGIDSHLFGGGGSGSSDQFGCAAGSGNAKLFWAYGVIGNYLTTTGTIPVNSWTHIAVSRSSNILKGFINGIQVYSGTMSSSVGQNAIQYIGSRQGGDNFYTGYLNDLRITNGYGRYTTNFTPPTGAFPTL